MKRNVFKPLLMLCFSMMYFLNLSGQNTQGNDSVVNPIYFDDAQIFPHNPGPTDSVFMVYSYLSTDACPDFHLVKDSVDKNSVYVLKLNILAQGQICAQVITKFKTKLFLGVFNEKTNFYLDGNLIATIDPHACNMDKMGKVISVTQKSSIIQEENAQDVYEIRDEVFEIGTLVKFHGTKIQCVTTPCYNIVDCFTIVDITDCKMDKKGVVVAGEGECANQLFVQELSPIGSKPVLYAIENNFINENPSDSATTNTESGFINGTINPVLSIGDEIQFGVKKLGDNQNNVISLCPVSGVVTCFEILNAEPECVMDKTGVVVTGEGECANQLFAQVVIDGVQVLYAIENDFTNEIPVDSTKLNPESGIGTGIVYPGLKVGDEIQFGVKKSADNYNNVIRLCPASGVVACYEILNSQPECIMDKKGVVVAGKGECEGKLFIKEYSLNNFEPQLFLVELADSTNTGVDKNNGTVAGEPFIYGLKEGDKVNFGAHYLKYEQDITSCKYVGVVTCYEIIDSTLQCIMDKKGVIVAGEGECAKKLFAQEIINGVQVLYAIENDFNNEIPVDSTIINPENGIDFGFGKEYPGLKVGDEIQFGVKKLANNYNNVISLCPVSGVVACYEILYTEPDCTMDKKGVVVEGKYLCEGQLFIREITPYLSTPKLYAFVPDGVVSDDGSFTSSIKVGDKVTFGSVSLKLDSIFALLIDSTFMPPIQDCAIAGFATCYEIVETQPTESYSISGRAIARNEVVLKGSAVLYAKNFKKALNAVPINNDGTFVFDNLIKGEYTVYIIPDIAEYKNFLPTFYVNKVHYKRADYVSLDKDINGMSIQLRPFNRRVGNGKIYGNIFFESTGLKDTVMAENGMKRVKVLSDFNLAANIPVILYDANDEPVDWTLTDENGNYVFENIAIESYKVVSESAAAEAEIPVALTVENTVVNADLMLKSSENSTALQTPTSEVINMYPNPVLDNLTINLKETQIVNIFNALGQLSIQKQLNSGSNMLDMSEMSKGVYFVKIGNSKTKLIKK